MLGEAIKATTDNQLEVLILVFREDMLGVHRRGGEARQVVLILVFREDMLGG